MRKLLLVVVLLVLLTAGLSASAGPLGQTGAEPPPTIITFDADLPAITLADAEAGQTTAAFSWVTVGVGEGLLLDLQTYRLNAWESLVPVEEQPLAPAGTLTLPVLHPFTFGPPTYRLLIYDSGGVVLNERVLTIPYDTNAVTEAPAIVAFTTTATAVTEADLTNGTARVQVSWEVANRTPTSNLVFQQVLPDARLESVELPRPNLWVGSTGEGPVAPVFAPDVAELQLRLQLVDLVDGTVLDQRVLTVPIQASVSAVPPTDTPAAETGGAAGGPTIITLTVSPNPVERGGTVTVAWEVRDAARVNVYRSNPANEFADFLTDQPSAGAWTLTLPEYHVDSAQFYLEAEGAGGVTAEASVAVQVLCPYSYFFAADEPEVCPLNEAVTQPAAWQPFERGSMLWRSDTGEIYVLLDEGSVSIYEDTWQEGETFDVGDAPAGFVAPLRGFGKVWAENTDLQDLLGWAITDEIGYETQLQQSGDFRYPSTFIAWPDGRVIAIVGGAWAFVDAASG